MNPPEPAEEPSANVGLQPRRLCTFELDLTCGHCVTVSVEGWYPVSVLCCDRLGGAWLRGTYSPFCSDVEYVRCLAERFEHRPAGARGGPTVLLDRRPRTDDPIVAVHRWQPPGAGRFPARVGGPANSRTA